MSAAPAGTSRDITFVEPLPGLPEHTHFTLAALPEAPELYTLRATRDDGGHQTRLFLLDPREFFPDYRPAISQETMDQLGSSDPAVLVVVHPATEHVPHTANLLAPVLVDPTSGKAVQLVQEGSDWPVRAPLTAAA